jgi:predicted kinase
MSLLVIVTGAPAAGKTTIARRLAQDLSLPLFTRDDLKESLFDSLGWSDRPWSAKLGAAAWELLYLAAERVLNAGQSLIIESNFRPQWANARITRLQAQSHCCTVQILCKVAPEVALTRYRLRVESGARHPGHVDHLNVETLRAELQQAWQPLDVDGELIPIDTTDFAAPDYASLRQRVQSHLAASR